MSKSCFIISPIGERSSETRRRSDTILNYFLKPVMDKLGYRIQRADNINSSGLITTQIIKRVVETDLLIADLTESNPNVFYELAIRHATKKPYIQIIEEGHNLPFDIHNVRTIKVNHKDIGDFMEKMNVLEDQIKNIETEENIESPISIFFDIQNLDLNRKIVEKLLSEMYELRKQIKETEIKISSKIEAESGSIFQPFLFPFLSYYQEFKSNKPDCLIISGSGVAKKKTQDVQFPGTGAVKRAEIGYTLLSRESGISEKNIHLVNAKDFAVYDIKKRYIFSIGSPIVNTYSEIFFSELRKKTTWSNQIIFEIFSQPSKHVKISLKEELFKKIKLDSDDKKNVKLSDGRALFKPNVSEDRMHGTDYGIVIRSVNQKGSNPQATFLIAGCRNYGTWASYYMSSEKSLIRSIMKYFGFIRADLESDTSFWLLIRGIGRNGVLNDEDISIIYGETF